MLHGFALDTHAPSTTTTTATSGSSEVDADTTYVGDDGVDVMVTTTDVGHPLCTPLR